MTEGLDESHDDERGKENGMLVSAQWVHVHPSGRWRARSSTGGHHVAAEVPAQTDRENPKVTIRNNDTGLHSTTRCRRGGRGHRSPPASLSRAMRPVSHQAAARSLRPVAGSKVVLSLASRAALRDRSGRLELAASWLPYQGLATGSGCRVSATRPRSFAWRGASVS